MSANYSKDRLQSGNSVTDCTREEWQVIVLPDLGISKISIC